MALIIQSEYQYRYRASGIFAPFIRHGHDCTDDMADLLYNAMTAGEVSDQEILQVLSSALLWRGKLRATEVDITVVLDVCQCIENATIERIHHCAVVLCRTGIRAIAVVAGVEWNEQALALAKTLGVAIASNGQVNADSWNAALTANH